jgi:hypothetical protein
MDTSLCPLVVLPYLPKPSVVMSMVVRIAFSAYNASHTYTPSRCRQGNRDERQSRKLCVRDRQ